MKAKTTGSGMALTDRDRHIVAAVSDFGVLTRAQVARHLRFGSVTRANAVLLRLARHGYLTRRVQPTVRGTRRQTYVLGPAGRELLHGTGARRAARGWLASSDLFVEHRLSVNDVRLAFHHESARALKTTRWLSEARLRQAGLGLIPDGYVEYESGGKSFAAFIEVDNGSEGRATWRRKVEAYLELARSGRHRAAFGREYFRVLVTATTERRLLNIRREIASHTDRVFWLALFSELTAHGPTAPIWQRPDGARHQSLVTPSQPAP